MRGLEGFIFSVLLPGLFGCLVGFGALFSIRKARRERQQRAERSQAQAIDVRTVLETLLVTLLFLVMPLSVTYAHIRIHYDLWALQPEEVQEIRVGEHHFTDRGSIRDIVSALKSSEWYSVNHGGWGDETPMVLRMASGLEWQMKAGYHFSQHGAVIRRSSEPNGRGWALGEVFSGALPDTLDHLGVPLSRCDTVHGHPCRTGATGTAP